MSRRRRPSLADGACEKLTREVNRPRVIGEIVDLGPDFAGGVVVGERYCFCRINTTHDKRFDELANTWIIIISFISTLLG